MSGVNEININNNIANNNQIFFNAPSGFYDQPFFLELSSDTDGDIYYTLDGSEPVISSSKSVKYEKPIWIKDATENHNIISMKTNICPDGYIGPSYKIDKCTVIRAGVFKNQCCVSDIKTLVYFVGSNNKDSIKNVNVLSIIMDNSDLFDFNKGIYVLGKSYKDIGAANYNQRGKEWERKCNIHYFDSYKTHLFSCECGIRVQGQSSTKYPQKNLCLYARKQYNEKKHFEYDFFKTGYYPEKIKLYAGGEDIITKSSDYMISKMFENNKYVDVHISIPCAVFLNGEYWGLYFITDKFDNNYIKNKYQIKKDDIIMIKNGVLHEGRKTDINQWMQIQSFIINNVMNDENYKKVCNFIDIDSYAFYYAIEAYTANIDGANYNWEIWRSKNSSHNNKIKNNKYRWMLFDIDESINNSEIDMISFIVNNNPIFKALIANNDFRIKFASALYDISTLYMKPQKVEAFINKYINNYIDALSASYKRYYDNTSHQHSIRDILMSRIDFFKKRPNIIEC